MARVRCLNITASRLWRPIAGFPMPPASRTTSSATSSVVQWAVQSSRTRLFSTSQLNITGFAGEPDTGNTFTQDFVNFVNAPAGSNFESFMESDTGQLTPQGGICYILTGATCPGALSATGTTGAVYNSETTVQPRALRYGNQSLLSETNMAQGLYTGAIAGMTYPVPDLWNHHCGTR